MSSELIELYKNGIRIDVKPDTVALYEAAGWQVAGEEVKPEEVEPEEVPENP